MIRPLLALLLAVSAARAEVLLGEPLPDPVAAAQAAAVEDYIAGARLEPFAAGRPSMGAAAGGLLGWLIPSIYAWVPTIDGQVSTDGNPQFDLQDDFGLDEGDLAGILELQVSLGGLGLRFSTFQLHFEGSNVLNRELTFGNVTFVVSERVDSVLDVNNYKLVGLIPLVKNDSLAFYLELGLSYYQLEGQAVAESGQSAHETADIPVPVLGGLVQMSIGRFLLEADVCGLTVDYGDISGDLLDVQLSVGVTVFKIVGIKAGYRYVMLDGRANNFTIDATLDGFFVGASFMF